MFDTERNGGELMEKNILRIKVYETLDQLCFEYLLRSEFNFQENISFLWCG